MSERQQQRYYPGRRTVLAFCCECDQEWEGGNVQGVAARHADATGHITVAEVTQCVVYCVPGVSKEIP